MTGHNRVMAKACVSKMQPVVHAEYVDTFVFSQTSGAALDVANSVMRELQRAGLRAHPVEGGRGGEALGWFFSAEEPLMSAKPQRLWRVRLALQHAMRRATLCGREIDVLIGHCTHLFLARRELLSCFSPGYKFMREAPVQAQVWTTVRRELRWAVALCCFCQRHLAMEVSREVLA